MIIRKTCEFCGGCGYCDNSNGFAGFAMECPACLGSGYVKDEYKCFGCGAKGRSGVTIHSESCKVGANEELNEALWMCDYLKVHMDMNDLSLPRVFTDYNEFMGKFKQ